MLKTAPFDAADYLKTPASRAEYITAALETNDPAFIRDAFRVVAQAEGITKVAQRAGMTRQGLHKSLGASGNPEFSTVISLLPALGMRLAAKPVRVTAGTVLAHRKYKKAAKRKKRLKRKAG